MRRSVARRDRCPRGDAEVRTPASFVHGQLDEQGRPVEGGSEITMTGQGTVLGGAAHPAAARRKGKESTGTRGANNMKGRIGRHPQVSLAVHLGKPSRGAAGTGLIDGYSRGPPGSQKTQVPVGGERKQGMLVVLARNWWALVVAGLRRALRDHGLRLAGDDPGGLGVSSTAPTPWWTASSPSPRPWSAGPGAYPGGPCCWRD